MVPSLRALCSGLCCAAPFFQAHAVRRDPQLVHAVADEARACWRGRPPAWFHADVTADELLVALLALQCKAAAAGGFGAADRDFSRIEPVS